MDVRAFWGRIGPPWVPATAVVAVALLAFALVKAFVGGGGTSTSAAVADDEAHISVYLASTRHVRTQSIRLTSSERIGFAGVRRDFAVTTADGRRWRCFRQNAAGKRTTACRPA